MQESGKTRPPVVGIFPVVSAYSGATIRHGMAAGKASAQVAILCGQGGNIVVVMADGNYGSSITNSASELVGFIYQLHIAPLGVSLDDTRWLYRDSSGFWDEIMPTLVHGTRVYCTDFRCLGGRQETDAMAAIAAEGVSLTDEEIQILSESLGFHTKEVCTPGGLLDD